MPTLRAFCDSGLVLENGRIEFYHDIEDAIARHQHNLDQSLAPGHARKEQA